MEKLGVIAQLTCFIPPNAQSSKQGITLPIDEVVNKLLISAGLAVCIPEKVRRK